jgi:hypothetical protein
MPLKRNTSTLDGTYGLASEMIHISWTMRAPSNSHGQATVNGSATLRTSNGKRTTITISVVSGGTVYLGSSSSVDTTDGTPILVGGNATLETTGAIFVKTGQSTDIRFYEETAGPDA